MLTVQFLIEGRVQGVGYRRFVQKQANELSLTGWTRNLTDGRVQVLAHGTPEQLEALEVRLKKGPLLSSVKNVIKENKSESVRAGFEIWSDAAAPSEE